MTRKIEIVEFKDDETYPIEKSAEGTNAYYCEFCNFAGYRPAYASCLNRIINGCNGALEASCATAIGQGHCMALKMQKEELKANKAIYYINRVKMRQVQVKNAEAMGIRLGERVDLGLKSVIPTASKPEMNVPNGIPHAPEFKSTGGYADAINKKMRELAKGDASPSTKDCVSSKNKVSGDFVKAQQAKPQAKKPQSKIDLGDTKGMSLLEIARLRKQQQAALAN